MNRRGAGHSLIVRQTDHLAQLLGQIRVLVDDPLKDACGVITSLTVVPGHVLAQRRKVGCCWIKAGGTSRIREPVVPAGDRERGLRGSCLTGAHSGKCLAQEFQHRRLLRIQFFDEPTKSATVATGLVTWSDGGRAVVELGRGLGDRPPVHPQLPLEQHLAGVGGTGGSELSYLRLVDGVQDRLPVLQHAPRADVETSSRGVDAAEDDGAVEAPFLPASLQLFLDRRLVDGLRDDVSGRDVEGLRQLRVLEVAKSLDEVAVDGRDEDPGLNGRHCQPLDAGGTGMTRPFPTAARLKRGRRRARSRRDRISDRIPASDPPVLDSGLHGLQQGVLVCLNKRRVIESPSTSKR